MKYYRNALLTIIVIVICILFYFQLSDIFTPKFAHDNWSIASTYLPFYEEAPNSIDVLFLGSSYGAAAFSPQVLYNNYGISSYNLCCEQQSLLTSYYWLQEALRYQSPKVVVIDPALLFTWEEASPLNSSEPYTRSALDFMKWSPVKKQAVKDVCFWDPEHKEISYYYPLFRYHDRWKDLEPEDFNASLLRSKFGLHGYVMLSSESENTEYIPFYPDYEKYQEMLPVMQGYLERIFELCVQNGMGLFFVRTPACSATIGQFDTLQQYADTHHLSYFDLNEARFYEKIQYDFAKDNAENSHANYKGAAKITDFVGEVLVEGFGLQGSPNPSFENTKSYYEMRIRND